ncbi:hypothetical protein [Demequina rhizosphaerae]|uniref:hypothetical protein n=1 Tax=Demequina rhizosphaerae TaxID=1638985 RepID=UPI00078616F8|nr:hypothetical protein [Demequina rhizosphaerae]
MSNELMESLARQAETGGALYDGRGGVDDAVVAPARRRVRRARTMRAAGTLGVTALVLAGGVAAALEWQGQRADVAPAITDVPDAPDEVTGITSDDLLTDTAARTRGETLPGQAAALCSYDETANPFSGDVGGVAFNCPAVWVSDAPLLDLSASATVEPDGAVDVTWTLTNVSDDALVVDRDAITLGLLTEPDAIVESTTGGDDTTVALSLWTSDSERFVSAQSGTEPISLEPGETLDGGSLLLPQTLGETTVDGMVEAMADGRLDPTVTLQVRIPPAGLGWATDELFLETSATVAPTGTLDPVSPAFVDLEPRTRDEVRADAQAAFSCWLGRANPRTGDEQLDDGYWTNAQCDAVWIPGGPQVALTDLTLTERDQYNDVVATWTITNISDHDVAIDATSAGLNIDLGDVGGITMSGGTTIGWTGWSEDGTRRYVDLPAVTEPVRLGPGGELYGEHHFMQEPGLKKASITLTVRVVRDDDSNGDRELFLEVPWNG